MLIHPAAFLGMFSYKIMEHVMKQLEIAVCVETTIINDLVSAVFHASTEIIILFYNSFINPLGFIMSKVVLPSHVMHGLAPLRTLLSPPRTGHFQSIVFLKNWLDQYCFFKKLARSMFFLYVG